MLAHVAEGTLKPFITAQSNSSTHLGAVVPAREIGIRMASVSIVAIASRLKALLPTLFAKTFVVIEIAVFHEVGDFVRFYTGDAIYVGAISHGFDCEFSDQVNP